MKLKKNKIISLLTIFIIISSIIIPNTVIANENVFIIEAESMSSSHGVKTERCNEGGKFVGDIDNGDWIKFNQVDLGSGVSRLDLRVATYTKGGTIEVRLGSNTGKLVGTAQVTKTGGKQKWATISCDINGASGVQDIYLVFKGDVRYLFNINWIKFMSEDKENTIDAFSKIGPDNVSEGHGIQLQSAIEGGRSIAYINNNDWVKFERVDFKEGASKAEIRISSDTKGGEIEIRVGSTAGRVIGKTHIGNTGGWQRYTTIHCDVEDIKGINDIYVVFKGGEGYLFNINYIKFVQAISNPDNEKPVGPKPEEPKPEIPSEPIESKTIYQVIQGHDGDPDPDDNGAALAGYMAIKRNIEENPDRVQFLGLIYGDTTEKRQGHMINGGGSSYNGSNGYANYRFYQNYTVPALKSVGCEVFYDTTPQTYNFNATDLSQMTTSGKFMTEKILWAINNSDENNKYRVVYSAGGGVNVPAEAVKYLKNIGYSDSIIKEHFISVQHSKWNYEAASEIIAQEIMNDFTIAISDQNGQTGHKKGVPTSVSVAKTSETFAKAWSIAVGGQEPDMVIPGFGSIDDISDAGSHSFSSNPEVLDKNWSIRNNGFNNRVVYTQYNVARVKADLCD